MITSALCNPFPPVRPHKSLFSLYPLTISLTLLCCQISEQAHLPLLLLCLIITLLLPLLLYALLNVGLMIVILPRLFSPCRFHVCTLNCYPSSNSSPRTICTTLIHIILSLAPLAHKYLNFICTKWWSSSFILYAPFAIYSWTCPFNHSLCLIRKPSSSHLCTMSHP